MPTEIKQQIEKIATRYGYEAQSRQLIEEMAELTQAINKLWRIEQKTDADSYSRITARKHILEEVADVEICLEQVKFLLSAGSVTDDIKQQKIERQLQRMEANKKMEGVIGE